MGGDIGFKLFYRKNIYPPHSCRNRFLVELILSLIFMMKGGLKRVLRAIVLRTGRNFAVTPDGGGKRKDPVQD